MGAVLSSQMRMTEPELLTDAVLQSWERAPVGTDVAVHADVAGESLGVPVEQEGHERRVGPEMPGVDNLDPGAGGEHLEVGPHPLEEDAGAEKPGECHYPIGPEPMQLFESAIDTRPSDAGIPSHDRAAAGALGEQPCCLVGIGVGIGIRGPAGEEGERQAGPASFVDSPSGQEENGVVGPERAAVVPGDRRMSLASLHDDGWDVGLRVPGCVQHEGQHRDAAGTAGDEPVAGDTGGRLRELEKPDLHEQLGRATGDESTELEQLLAAGIGTTAVPDEEDGVAGDGRPVAVPERLVLVVLVVLFQGLRSLPGERGLSPADQSR